jgi:hypothetical protein
MPAAVARQECNACTVQISDDDTIAGGSVRRIYIDFPDVGHSFNLV